MPPHGATVCDCAYLTNGDLHDKMIKLILLKISFRQATKITGIGQLNFNDIFEKVCLQKISRILKDSSHPFYNKISFSPRSNRIILIKTKKERFKNSFLPMAVKLYSLTQHR